MAYIAQLKNAVAHKDFEGCLSSAQKWAGDVSELVQKLDMPFLNLCAVLQERLSVSEVDNKALALALAANTLAVAEAFEQCSSSRASLVSITDSAQALLGAAPEALSVHSKTALISVFTQYAAVLQIQTTHIEKEMCSIACAGIWKIATRMSLIQLACRAVGASAHELPPGAILQQVFPNTPATLADFLTLVHAEADAALLQAARYGLESVGTAYNSVLVAATVVAREINHMAFAIECTMCD
jgi:hypothetical protein